MVLRGGRCSKIFDVVVVPGFFQEIPSFALASLPIGSTLNSNHRCWIGWEVFLGEKLCCRKWLHIWTLIAETCLHWFINLTTLEIWFWRTIGNNFCALDTSWMIIWMSWLEEGSRMWRMKSWLCRLAKSCAVWQRPSANRKVLVSA